MHVLECSASWNEGPVMQDDLKDAPLNCASEEHYRSNGRDRMLELGMKVWMKGAILRDGCTRAAP